MKYGQYWHRYWRSSILKEWPVLEVASKEGGGAMIESYPLLITDEEVAYLQDNFPKALNAIKVTEEMVRQAHGHYQLEAIRDGKQALLEVDKTVVHAMKGAVLGMYREMSVAGLHDIAQSMVEEARLNRPIVLYEGMPRL